MKNCEINFGKKTKQKNTKQNKKKILFYLTE